MRHGHGKGTWEGAERGKGGGGKGVQGESEKNASFNVFICQINLILKSGKAYVYTLNH